eukprot:TRINITY_DN68934_c0_g1_i1.p1 TRINITY_DN68934_c0_g1~~TRINITY_DN68934_c0_g1_i1.p1  ORF type:complete len:214 (-),score=23.83 TRINITY_DN68934_c0_g1_i1:93-734(-)
MAAHRLPTIQKEATTSKKGFTAPPPSLVNTNREGERWTSPRRSPRKRTQAGEQRSQPTSPAAQNSDETRCQSHIPQGPLPVEAELLTKMVAALDFAARHTPHLQGASPTDTLGVWDQDWDVVGLSATPLLRRLRQEGEAQLLDTTLRHGRPLPSVLPNIGNLSPRGQSTNSSSQSSLMRRSTQELLPSSPRSPRFHYLSTYANPPFRSRASTD